MSKEASWRAGKVKKPAEWCRLAERRDDARLDTCTAVREHNRPKDRRTSPLDERPEAAIEKRRADGLDVGEVKAHNMPWIGFVASVFNVRIDPADRRAQYVCLRSVVS